MSDATILFSKCKNKCEDLHVNSSFQQDWSKEGRQRALPSLLSLFPSVLSFKGIPCNV